MNPGRLAELRSAKAVRGGLMVGTVCQVLYMVTVTNGTYARAQELTHEGALPTDLVWLTWDASPGRVEVHTNRPEWFVELEEMIDASKRQPYR